jgi:hypothetical protein
MPWRAIVFSAVATFVGAFVLDALLDGTAFWIALAVLGVAVGASLRWVVPRKDRSPGQYGRP